MPDQYLSCYPMPTATQGTQYCPPGYWHQVGDDYPYAPDGLLIVAGCRNDDDGMCSTGEVIWRTISVQPPGASSEQPAVNTEHLSGLFEFSFSMVMIVFLVGIGAGAIFSVIKSS